MKTHEDGFAVTIERAVTIRMYIPLSAQPPSFSRFFQDFGGHTKYQEATGTWIAPDGDEFVESTQVFEFIGSVEGRYLHKVMDEVVEYGKEYLRVNAGELAFLATIQYNGQVESVTVTRYYP